MIATIATIAVIATIAMIIIIHNKKARIAADADSD